MTVIKAIVRKTDEGVTSRGYLAPSSCDDWAEPPRSWWRRRARQRDIATTADFVVSVRCVRRITTEVVDALRIAAQSG